MNTKSKLISRPITFEEISYVKFALKNYEEYVEENEEKYYKTVNILDNITHEKIEKMIENSDEEMDFMIKYVKFKFRVIPSIKNVLKTQIVYVREDDMEYNEDELLWFKITKINQKNNSKEFLVDFLMDNMQYKFMREELDKIKNKILEELKNVTIQ